MAPNWPIEYHRYRRYFVNISQFYRQKKVRVYTELVLSILTVTFFLYFAIKPTLTTIAVLFKTIKDQKLVVEKLEDKVNALNLAQKQFLAVESDLYLVDQALPKDPHLSTLAKELEALARRTKVTIGTIQFNQTTLRGEPPAESQTTVKFSLAAGGNYLNLKDFLQSLSSLRRIILVQSFSFKTGKVEKEALNLNINADAYYEPMVK